MSWIGAFVIFALAQSTLAAIVAEKPNHEYLSATCEEYPDESQSRFNSQTDLGVWYEVGLHPRHIICVNFELITDQYRETLDEELNLTSEEEGKLENYSLVITRECPGVKINDSSSEFHLWEEIDDSEAQFNAVGVRNNTVSWNKYKAKALKFMFNGKVYFGVIESKHKFEALLSRECEDFYEENYIYNLYVCFEKISMKNFNKKLVEE